jgi:hypothetical protein
MTIRMDFSKLTEEETENFLEIALTFGTVTLEDTVLKCLTLCFDIAQELNENGEATLYLGHEEYENGDR